MAADARLVAAVLAAHQVEVAWTRRYGRWRWSCSCLTDGTDTYHHPRGGWQAAEAHQAEHIIAALTAAPT